MKIKVSSQWLNHKFLCSPEYIVNHCKGRCCRGTKELVISILPEEEPILKGLAFAICIKGGLLYPEKGNECPFKIDNGLCLLHNLNLKPFGCIISPFTINKNNTLIIRHRYSKLKCHGEGQYSYIVFKPSLVKLFGETGYQYILDKMKENKDFYIDISDDILNKLKYLDNLKNAN
jgi:hypothetical protein